MNAQTEVGGVLQAGSCKLQVIQWSSTTGGEMFVDRLPTTGHLAKHNSRIGGAFVLQAAGCQCNYIKAPQELQHLDCKPQVIQVTTVRQKRCTFRR